MDVKSSHKQRKTTGLTQQELAVLRKSSKLGDKEIKLYYEAFLEVEPSGKLDQNAFIAFFERLDPQYDKESCLKIFHNVDKNSDGTIDFNEFLFLFAVKALSGDLNDRLEVIFDFWDISDDGHLDQNELSHLISAMYDRAGEKDRQGDKDPNKRAKEIIEKLDLNKDKKLSKEEFIKGCANDEVLAKLLAPAPANS